MMETVIRDRIRMWLGLDEIEKLAKGIDAQTDACRFLLEEIRSVLTEASRLKSLRSESAFDRDKIPAMETPRYVPISVRRARAERESIGPQTHTEQVRQNNAKAFGE